MSARNTPYQPWMRSLLNRMKELYGKPDAKTISEALPDGDFFEIKGAVDEVSDLPASDNNVGDIYIVSEDGGEYIWVTSEEHPGGYWEQLGANITPESIGAEPEKLVVTVTESGGVFSADKTFAEIAEALSANKSCIVQYGYVEFSLFNSDADTYAVFYSIILDTYGVTTVIRLEVDDADTWTYKEKDYAPKQSIVTDASSTDVTLTSAADNTIYEYGELTSLTISNPPATGAYSIVFTSGATATTTTIPATILGLEDFAAEANTMYEINVLNNRAVVGSWAVSA